MSHNLVPRGCYAYNEWTVHMDDKVISCVEYYRNYYRNSEPFGVLETTYVNNEVVNEEFVKYDESL